ncbi:MAG TPA: M20/M25/M40 family metallo-hydrolase [Thermoanaerobaculia bacterium]|nr:M20/M25/M40 family metallo-hydrolase [Thermoanaerobaculia bacterium]
MPLTALVAGCWLLIAGRDAEAQVAGNEQPATLASAEADRLVSRALDDTRAYDTLAHLTDNIGARLSGSRGAELAVKWATQQFKAWGIDVRNEPVKVPHWVRGVERATLVSHNDQRIVLTALGGSVATPAAGITADLIEVANYDELKALGTKVKGKIVVYDNPMDMDMVRNGRAFDAYREAVEYRGRGASRAAEYGAVAALIRSVGSASLRTPHTGSLRYDEKLPRIPAAAMTMEDSMLVHRLLAKGERVRMHLTLTPKTLPDVQSANVVAEIRGTERPEEIVLIGAHLDSWDLGTGAIDDGSGVAMVMETMRLMKELGLKPRRTIRAVLFMNEENGLRGGRAYFAAHKNEKHVAAIETDAGAAAPTGFRTSLKGDALAELEGRTKVLGRVGAHKFESTPETGADTSFLVEAGVPGYGFVPDARHYFDYHHTPADTLDKVDPKELAQDTAAIAALAWLLAE